MREAAPTGRDPPDEPDTPTEAALFFDLMTGLGIEVIFGHTGGAVVPLHVELNRRMRARRIGLRS